MRLREGGEAEDEGGRLREGGEAEGGREAEGRRGG